MKLHLPNMLRKALLAVVGIAGSTAYSMEIRQWNAVDLTSATNTDGILTLNCSSSMIKFGVTPDWELEGEVDLIYVSSSGNSWGFKAEGSGDISARATSGKYTADNNSADAAVGGVITQQALVGEVDEVPSVSLIADFRGTALYALGGSSALYSENTLRYSNDTITTLSFNETYISSVYTLGTVDSVTDGQSYLVSNSSGSWMKEFSTSNTKFVYGSELGGGESGRRMKLVSADALAGMANVVVGKSNQLFIQTWSGDKCTANIVLNQDVYLGSTSLGAAIRFGMDDFDVTMSGDIYLVENAKMQGSNPGSHVINLTGKLTDKVAGEAGVVDTNSVLTLSGGKYNLSGEVDLRGITVEQGIVNVSGKVDLDVFTAASGTTVGLTGGNLSIKSGVSAISGTLISEASGKGLTVGVDSEQTAILSVNRMEMGNIKASGDGHDFLTINEGSLLKVTGSQNTDSGQDFKSRSIVLGEWNQKTQLNVYGSMFSQNAVAFAGIKGVDINIGASGILAVQGLSTARTSDTNSVLNLTLSDGGSLILGSEGISASTVNPDIRLGAGVVGTYADTTTIGAAISLQSAAGTVFDTTKYAFAQDGNSISQLADGTPGNMIISGAISGAGTLIKVGSGKLTLSGAVGTEESHLSSVTISNGELAIQGNAYISSLALTGNEANADLRVVSGATLNAGTILSKENISENRDIFVESGATMTVDNLHVAYKMGQIDVDGTLNVGTLKLSMNQTNDDMVIGDGTLSVQTLNVYNQTKTAISTETLSVGEGGLNITGNSSILKLYSATTTVAGATVVGTNQLFFESGNAELNGAVTSNGTTTVNGGTVSMGSTFDNQSSGVFTAAAGVTAVAGAVTNAGTLNVNGGEVDMESTLTNNSGAELNVTAGSVTVTGAVTNAGTFNVNGGSVTLAGGVSGAGSVELNSGSLTLGANSEIGRFVYNEGTLSHSGLTIGDAIFSGGTLENSGNLTLNGTLTVTSTLGLTLSGEATYSGGAVDGNGYANATYQVITGGNITYGTGEDGFTFKWGEEVLDVLDGVAPQAGDSAYATKTENALTLTVAGNSGIFYVNTGTETLAVDKADSYYVKSGARLEFIQEASNRVIEKEINGDGTVAVAFGESDFNGALNFGEGFNGVAEVSGKMNLQNTRLGTNATLKLGNAQISNSAATTYAGNIELTGTAVDSVTIAGSALTLNGAVTGTNLSTGADLTLTNAANNLGQLRITAGTTTISAAGGTYGTLSLTGGTLNINESNFNVTEGIKQTDGTVNFYSGTVNLAGESSFTKLDMAGGDDRSGHLILQEGAKMTSTGYFWLASSAKVTLLNGATLTRDGITLTGKGDTSVLKENGNKDNLVSFSSSNHQVTDMAVSVSSGSETTLGLKLITSDVTNSGTGKLIISDGAHTINTLHAKSGDIEFSSQSSPTVATAKVEEGKTLTLNGGASINNIEAAKGTVALASGKTLTLNGSASIGKMDAANGIVVQALGSTMSLADQSENTIGTLTATQSEFYVGEGAAVTINGGLNLYEKNDSGIGSTVYLAADSVMSVALVLGDNNENARFSMNAASAVELEAGAKFYLRDILNVTGLKHDGEQKSTINSTGWMVYSNEKDNVVMNNAAVQYTMNGNTDLKNCFTNSSLEIATQGSDVTTITNASNTITELSLTGGNAKLSESMTVQSISAKAGKAVTVANGKTISMAGGVSIGTNGADATMTAKSDSALARLQKDATFTIQDMTLTNTTITAATVDTKVNLKNVSGDVALKTGIFGVEMTTVGMGGSALSYAEGAPSITLSSTDAGAAKLMISANPTLDVQGAYGTYSLTFNLNLQLDSGIDEPASNETWAELVGFDGWLGTMLEDQQATFAGAAGEPVVQSSAPSVSYGYTAGSGGNVGTLTITINGLNVPEPTTSTLSLLALAGLCARRRRKM